MRFKAYGIISAAAICLLVGMTNVKTAYAEIFNKDTFQVTFTSSKKMESNFQQNEIGRVVEEMQPGDVATFKVNFKNAYSTDTDWYMNNKVLQSLEESVDTAKAGGYTYALTFTDSSGKVNTLYNSENVGGENYIKGLEGLHEATNALEDFFYLTTLKPGQGGSVALMVAIDGEAQGNGYQDTLGKLALNFAVELPAEDNRVVTERENRVLTQVRDFFRTGFVKTSDNVNLILLYIIAGIIGVLLIVIGIICIRIRKKMKKGEDK